MKHLSLALLVVIASLTSTHTSFAQMTGLPKGMPICRDQSKKVLPFGNAEVVKLKTTTPNLYKQQVFVKAQFVSMGSVSQNSYGKHLRFIVSLADKGKTVAHENLIEISQSMNGYIAPTAADLTGTIYICGEYSTTDMNKLPKITDFEPSATGAMIHWTHAAGPDVNVPTGRHPHGWLYANGKLFGVYAR